MTTSSLDITNDDNVIDYAQNKRVDLISHLSANGIPVDLDEQEFMRKTLADLATTALNKKKLGAQVRESELDRQAALFISTVLKKTGNQSPFAAEQAIAEKESPELPHQIEASFQVSDTELIQGLNTERYDEFMERMAPVMEADRKAEEDAVFNKK